MKVKLGNDLLRPLSLEQIQSLTRDQLITMLVSEQSVRLAIQEDLDATKNRYVEISNQAKNLRNMLFGSRSERRSRSGSDRSPAQGESHQEQQESERSRGNTGRQTPSERYPNAEVQERHIFPEESCSCKVCGHELEDSGLSEISEYLSVIPKRFIVIRQYRHKFRCCQCHGTLETAPNPARVIPRSSYSDDLLIDVTVSKYCDLIPIERYSRIAEWQGFRGIPPHSLIELSIQLGFFLQATFERLKREVLDSPVVHADETPHRMLEGDPRKHWYLWVFMNAESCIFECHDSRSGDIAAEILKAAGCEVVISDVYSGYRKAVREANEVRALKGMPEIDNAYCNAHARRGFTGPSDDGIPEAIFMIDKYAEIYKLEALGADCNDEGKLAIRAEMKPIFEQMRVHAQASLDEFSNKSSIATAMQYFLKNFKSLTYFIDNPIVSIDNNSAERALRSPVIGRKTWYGSHSKRGAKAAAIHFSIIESCKLNNVNPREYYKAALQQAHSKLPPITPREYKLLLEAGEAG